MRYHDLETTVAADGSIRVKNAPIPAGHRVSLRLIDLDASPDGADAHGKLPIEEVRRLLAGTVVSFGDLMAPAYTDEEMDEFENAPLMPGDEE